MPEFHVPVIVPEGKRPQRSTRFRPECACGWVDRHTYETGGLAGAAFDQHVAIATETEEN